MTMRLAGKRSGLEPVISSLLLDAFHPSYIVRVMCSLGYHSEQTRCLSGLGIMHSHNSHPTPHFTMLSSSVFSDVGLRAQMMTLAGLTLPVVNQPSRATAGVAGAKSHALCQQPRQVSRFVVLGDDKPPSLPSPPPPSHRPSSKGPRPSGTRCGSTRRARSAPTRSLPPPGRGTSSTGSPASHHSSPHTNHRASAHGNIRATS